MPGFFKRLFGRKPKAPEPQKTKWPAVVIGKLPAQPQDVQAAQLEAQKKAELAKQAAKKPFVK